MENLKYIIQNDTTRLTRAYCFAIKLKGHHRNSAILKNQAYKKLIPAMGMTYRTFFKYMNELYALGWAEKKGNVIRIKKMISMTIEMNEVTDLFIGKHRLIEVSETKTIKELQDYVYSKLIEDNVYNHQKYVIDKNKALYKVLSKVKTENNRKKSFLQKHEYSMYKKAVKKYGSFNSAYNQLKRHFDNALFSNKVVTSSKAIAALLGLSQFKANQLLRSLPNHSEQGHYVFEHEVVVKNATNAAEELLRTLFPDAFFLRHRYRKDLTLHFGTEITNNPIPSRLNKILYVPIRMKGKIVKRKLADLLKEVNGGVYSHIVYEFKNLPSTHKTLPSTISNTILV
jgi:hypothetical protein